MSTLIIDVRPGEKLQFSGAAAVELVQKSGQLARLRVIAQKDVKVEKKSDAHAGLRGKHAQIEPS